MYILQPDKQRRGWWELWRVDTCCRRRAHCQHNCTAYLLSYNFTCSLLLHATD